MGANAMQGSNPNVSYKKSDGGWNMFAGGKRTIQDLLREQELEKTDS
jgi:hypothetical protein